MFFIMFYCRGWRKLFEPEAEGQNAPEDSSNVNAMK